jgi:hypothetical protein
MSLGGHWVPAHGKSFILLVGKKVDFGAEELSDQRAGRVWLAIPLVLRTFAFYSLQTQRTLRRIFKNYPSKSVSDLRVLCVFVVNFLFLPSFFELGGPGWAQLKESVSPISASKKPEPRCPEIIRRARFG